MGRGLRRDQRGASAVEYLIVVGVLALAGVGAFAAFGGATERAFLGGETAAEGGPDGAPRRAADEVVGGARGALGDDPAARAGGWAEGTVFTSGAHDSFADAPAGRDDATATAGVDEMDAARAAELLLDHFDEVGEGDSRLRREDLERVKGDPHAPDDLRAAASYLLEHDSVRHMLDLGAGGGDVDDKISREDLEGALASLSEMGDWDRPTDGVVGDVDTLEEAERVLERYEALTDTASGGGGNDGFASVDDLAAILDDESLPLELRQAAYVKLTEDPPDSCRGLSLCHLGGVAGWVGDRWGDFHDLRNGVQDWVGDRIDDGARLADAGLGWTVDQLRNLEQAAYDLPGPLGYIAGAPVTALRRTGELTHGAVNATTGMISGLWMLADFATDLSLGDPAAVAAVAGFAQAAWEDPRGAWDLTYEVGRAVVSETLGNGWDCVRGDAYSCGELAPDVILAVATGGGSAILSRGGRAASLFARHTDDLADGARIAARAGRHADDAAGVRHLDDLLDGRRAVGLDPADARRLDAGSVDEIVFRGAADSAFSPEMLADAHRALAPGGTVTIRTGELADLNRLDTALRYGGFDDLAATRVTVPGGREFYWEITARRVDDLTDGTRLVVGGGRADGFPRLGDRDISVNLDPAARPDVLADANRLPFRDGKVDEVYFERVQYDLLTDDGMSALEEAARVLEPDGRVRIVTGSGVDDAALAARLDDAGFTDVRVETVVRLDSRDPIDVWTARPLPTRIEPIGTRVGTHPSALLDEGRMTMNELMEIVPEGTPNTWVPGQRIDDGFKYVWEDDGVSYSVWGHEPDLGPNAGSNASGGWTARVEIDGRYLRQDGTVGRNGMTDAAHIPLEW